MAVAMDGSLFRSKGFWVAPLVVSWAISVAYIFSVGIDWRFTSESNTVINAILTGSILSLWAAVPYLILLPIAERDDHFKALSSLGALAILAFGAYAMNRARHTAGDEGGSYIIVPLQQILIASVIRGIAKWARSVAH